MTTTETPMTTTPAPPAPLYPCDRCSEVRPVYPYRPGELLCRPCRDAARHAERNPR